ncbi:MAG: PSD1 and planctomycete cytochrome C domain-containing protein [Planctomycetaceae bacterium]
MRRSYLCNASGLWLALCFIGGASPMLHAAPTDGSDAQGVEFFERQIRPLFASKCYRCHSRESKKTKGGLLLDSPETLLKGGDSGELFVTGDPDNSLLIKAVRYQDEDLRMPPDGKRLTEAEVADLEEWVRRGAPLPKADIREDKIRATARTHWAFQPVKQPAVPAVKNQGWVQSPVDAFIHAKLEDAGLEPSPPADKRTLLRRATYDLIGLPPAPEEVAAFLADDSPQAFPDVVDRLLGSPQYGERWGRHWLDVARYANSKQDATLQFAFSYRDYVIRAFNDDLPYDRFILEQIAADQLEAGNDNHALAALGFLTVGRRFSNNIHDTIDDRIDVITRGLMGLTVTCARCHDHKYDPIPTEDYYSLHGVLSNSTEPNELPVLQITSDPTVYTEYLAKRARLEKNVEVFLTEKVAEAQRKHRAQSGDYLLLAWQLRNGSMPEGEAMLFGEDSLRPSCALRWKDALGKWEQEHHPIFAPWFAFAALPEGEFASRAEQIAVTVAANDDADHPVNPLVAQAFAGTPPASLKEVSERYGRLFREVDKNWKALLDGHTYVALVEWQRNPKPPTMLPDPYEEALRQVLYAEDAPGHLPPEQARKQFNPQAMQALMPLLALQLEIRKLDASHPGSPPRAMVLADSGTPKDGRIFIRGNPGNPGREVPRQFLGIVAGPERAPFQNGSGRLELAQAIASRNNPLTARFFVNRVWMHHFGAGLVNSGDFGLRSEPPTHPALLDYLAWRFMDEGWSLKKLHRLVMLSNAYQQESDNDLRNEKCDPENRLLSKMNRRRLDFEAMRDTILALAGNLDAAFGGRPVDLAPPPALRNPRGGMPDRDPPPDKLRFSTRRSIYGVVDRQNLPGLFRVFDFADPDMTNAQRAETTIPQQALFFLNSVFVQEEAKRMLKRPDLAQLKPGTQWVRRFYQIVYQRDPSPEELERDLEYIIKVQSALVSGQAAADGQAPTGEERLTPWEQYVQVLLMSNELMFVD